MFNFKALSLALATTIISSTVAFAKAEPYSTKPLVKTNVSQKANSHTHAATTATKDIAPSSDHVSHKAQEAKNTIKDEAKDKSQEATQHSDKTEKAIIEKDLIRKHMPNTR